MDSRVDIVGGLPLSVGFGVGAIIDRLFSSRRLGEWKTDASIKTCAGDVAAYLTEKGWVVLDERRRRYIRSVPLWTYFLDPFHFTSDGRKFVLRSNWDEVYVIEISAGGVRWSVRPSNREECLKFDGMRLLLSELHNEYFEIAGKRTTREKSESLYVDAWLTLGKEADPAWLEWMPVCVNPNEAIAWANLGIGPETIARWLSLKLGLVEAQKWLEIGASIKDAEAWIGAGWTTSEAIRKIKSLLNSNNCP